MKKEHSRCIKRIVAAALVLLTVSGTVPAQPIAQTFSTAITASADSVSDWSESTSLPTTAGSYKLTTDVTLSSKWEVTENITLDLNGHGIIRTGSNGNAIRVKNNATLTINDSGDTTHYFDVVDGIAKNINDESGEQSFTGGYITGGTGEGFNGYFWGDGGGVYVLHGNCIMNGGTLLGNSTGFGGGAEVYDGTFTLNGGKIAYNGGDGAVVVRSGSSQYNIDGASTANFVMNGGEISNNKNYGLSRYYCYGESSVTLNAGNICNNGGGGANVYNAVIKDIEITGNTRLGLSGSKITLSGSPVITGNGGDTPKNLVVNENNPVTIENLGDNTNIGVTVQSGTGVFTNNLRGNGSIDMFTVDNNTYGIRETAAGEAMIYTPGTEYWVAYFDGNGGSGSIKPIETVKGDTLVLPECDFTAPAGKLFSEWSSSTDNTVYSSGDTVTMTDNTTFTAQWVDGKIASFAAGEGSGNAPENIVVLPGNTITLPKSPFTPPTGYIFVGWSDGTSVFNAGESYALNEDTTFTAQWEEGEGFENGLPSDWTIESTNNSYQWTVGVGDKITSEAHSGDKNAKITHSSSGSEAYLVMPVMNLSDMNAVSLSCWYVNRNWGGDIDAFGIYYRIDNGDWVELFSTTAAHPTWTNAAVTLPDEALTENVQIGFYANDKYGYGIGLDDVVMNFTLKNFDFTDESLQDSNIQIFDKVGGNEVEIKKGKSYVDVENGYVIFSDRTLSFDGAEVTTYFDKKQQLYRYTVEDIEAELIKVTHVPEYEYKNSEDESQLLQRDKGIVGNETWELVAGISIDGIDDNNEVVYSNDYTPVVKDQNGNEITDVVITYAVKGKNSYDDNRPSDKGDYTAQAAVKVNGVNYYLKKDFTITAKSIELCTVNATPDGKTYDGSEVTPVVEVKDGDKVLEAGKDYTVTITPEANVGEYTITVTGSGNYKDTNSDVWSIDKANMPELTIEGDTEKTYDGTASTYTVKNAPAGTTLTYEYFKGNESIGANAPKDAGSYTLKVTAENSNYNNGTATLDFVINKKAVTLKPNAVTKTYGEADPTAFEFTADGIVADADKTLFANALKIEDGHSENVGTYNIVLADPTTVYDNYTVSVSDNEGKFEITKKALTAEMFSYDGDSTFVYDGTAHTVTVTGKDSGVAAQGTALTSDDYTVGDTKSATKAGEYSVTVTAAENGNYKGTAELSSKWSITRKSIADSSVTITVDPQNKTYDGKETTPVVTVTDNSIKLVEGDDYTLTISSGKNAGEYDYEIVGIGNYKDTVNGKWSISKSDVTNATVSCKDKIYDGAAYSEENITVAGLPSDFAPSYSYEYKSGSDTLTSAPSDAGDYKVVVTAKDNNGNYNDVVLEQSFKIAKRTVEVFPEEGQSKVYGQADPTIVYDVEEAKEDSLTGLVSTDKKDIFAEVFGFETGYDGSVGFWNIVADNTDSVKNYTISYTDPVQLEVTPKQLTADFFALDNDSFVYSGKKNTVKVTDFEDKDNDSAVLTENDFDTAGTFSAYTPGSYSVEIKGQGNYTGTAYLNWTIAPNTDTSATTNAESYVYDGTAHEVSVTANDDKTLPKNSQITYAYYAVETNEEGEIVSETKLDEAPVNAGYYKVQGVVTARGYEIEVAPAYFTISKKQIAVTVNADDLTSVYDSEEKEIGYTYDDTLIVEGDDAEVSGTITVVGDHTDVKYDDEGNIAGYDVDLSGLTINSSNYELVLPENVKYFVTPRDIQDDDIKLTTSSVARPDKGYAEVDFKVVVNGKELVKGTDYDVAGTFKSGSTGDYTVQVEGIGNYSGIALADWSVVETNDDKDAAIAAIEEATTLTISDAKPTVNVNGVGRVTATVTREVADGFTIESTGFIYIKDAESTVELTLENVGKDGVSKAVGTNTNGSKTLNVTDPNGSGARMVGYVTVTDGTYSKTIYTDEVKATYEGLVAAEKEAAEREAAERAAAFAAIEEATTITITDPIATVNASGVGRVTSKVTREVADGFTIEETGIIYIKDSSSTIELTLENVGTDGVAKATSANTNGSKTLNVTDPDGNGARMVGYVTVSDGSYSKTIYTNEVSGRYLDLK